MKKKLLSAALAAAMAMSLSIPAFAADGTEATDNSDGTYGAETDLNAGLAAMTIKVTVPAENDVFINPYQLEVQNESGEYVSDEIVSPTNYIKSESNVSIDVGVKIAGTVAGDAVLASATVADAEDAATKEVFLQFQITEAPDDSDPAAVAWDSRDTSKDQVVAASAPQDPVSVYVLPSAVVEGSTEAKYCAFRLAGDAQSTPKTAWTAADTVAVNIAFTFTPCLPSTT